MVLTRSKVWLAIGLAVLPVFTGCGDDSGAARAKPLPSAGPAASSSSSSSAKPTTNEKPQTSGDEVAAKSGDEESESKKVALPEVPSGAGPIDEDAPEVFTKTASGLKYRILRKSDDRKPQPDDLVIAAYKGWLDGGKSFDASYGKSAPFEFMVTTRPPKGVIPGWVEGVQLIGVGGMIELEIPADLGYGPRGYPGAIPPNATLHFIMEVKEIK